MFFGILLCICAAIDRGFANYTITTRVGGVAILYCSTTTEGRAEWKQKPIGKDSTLNYIYVDSEITDAYMPGGRHNVSVDRQTGACDLVITNVVEGDAGKYICTEVTLERKALYIELIVLLGTAPTCRPNISLTNVLVENDCNLESDSIEFNCTAAYRGNLHPQMQLQFTSIGVLNEVTVHNWQHLATNYITIRWAAKASWRIKSGKFICEVKNTSEGIDSSCSSTTVSVMYFYESKRSLEISPSKDNQAHHFVTCAANTSEQCSYSWKVAHPADSAKSSGVLGPTIDLKDREASMRCRAECKIRDNVCISEPMLVEFESTYMSGENSTSAAAIVVPLVLLVGIIIVAVLLRKYISGFLARCRRKRETTAGEMIIEQVQLRSQNSVVFTSNQIKDFIRQNQSTLEDMLESDDGLADHLFSKSVLTNEQYNRIRTGSNWKSYQEQNRELIGLILKKDDSECTSFIEALLETNQRHVANFLRMFEAADDNKSTAVLDDDCRILTEEEQASIDRNTFTLVHLMDFHDDFLKLLSNKGCISQQQKDRIQAHRTKQEKNQELLSIMRRRSYADLRNFKSVLKTTNQDNMVKILDRKTGGALSVHIKTTVHAPGTNFEDISKEEEATISELLNDSCRSPLKPSTSKIADGLEELRQRNIHLVGAAPIGSIVVFFLCTTFQSVVSLKEMIKSGRLQKIMECIFNSGLKSPTFQVNLALSHDEVQFKNCIDEARRTIYLEDDSNSCHIRVMPLEMREMIFLKATIMILGRIFGETCFPEMTEEVFHSSKNITFKHVRRGLCDAAVETFINMSFVSYTLFLNLLKDPRAKKRYVSLFLASKLRKSKSMVLERIEIRSNLIAQFQKTLSERDNSMHQGDREKSGQEEQVPAQLIRYLITGNYGDILEFLQLLEQTRQVHIFNYIISDGEYQSVFGKCWPIDIGLYKQISANSNKIIEDMNPLLNFREMVNKAAPIRNISLSAEDLLATIDKDEDSSSFPRLADILYNKRCISSEQKRRIDECGYVKDKNKLIVEAWLKGNIDTVETSLTYFRGTGQSWVVSLLTGFHFREDVNVSAVEKVKGIFFRRQKLYVVLEHSNEISIFNARDPKTVTFEDKIPVPGMAAPSDLTISKKRDLIFVSDVTENCLWEIKLWDRAVSKWPMPRKPNRVSISCEDNLLVVSSSVENSGDVNEQFLDIYESDDQRISTPHTLPTDVKKLFHAVQLSNKNVIISYESKQTKNNLVSEISTNGAILRSFTLASTKARSTAASIYLCVNDKDGVYVANSNSNEILYFDTTRTSMENLSVVSTTMSPARLCYSSESSYKMLFVGVSTSNGLVSVLYKKKLTAQRSLRNSVQNSTKKKMFDRTILSIPEQESSFDKGFVRD